MHYLLDSQMTLDEALTQNPDFLCPQDVLDKQRLLEVLYCSFDDKIHKGQIVVSSEVAQDVKDVFQLMYDIKFPIEKVIPVAAAQYHWSDSISIADNNTSGFNYRFRTLKTVLSDHAYGRAIDINPKINPFIKGDFVEPPGGVYDPSILGTITAASPIVEFLKKRGWDWGGEWTDLIDYQHFEKPTR